MPLAKLFEFHNVSHDKVTLGHYNEHHGDRAAGNHSSMLIKQTPLPNTTHKRYYQDPQTHVNKMSKIKISKLTAKNQSFYRKLQNASLDSN